MSSSTTQTYMKYNLTNNMTTLYRCRINVHYIYNQDISLDVDETTYYVYYQHGIYRYLFVHHSGIIIIVSVEFTYIGIIISNKMTYTDILSMPAGGIYRWSLP